MGIGMNESRDDVVRLVKAIPPKKMCLVFASPPFDSPRGPRHRRAAAGNGKRPEKKRPRVSE
jgi:hypothetical protein